MNQLLPWEWRPEYRLRTIIFPLFLAIPIRFLKLIGLDSSSSAIEIASTLMHCGLLLLTDEFFKKLGNELIGQEATSYAAVFYLFNHTFVQQMHRSFSCSFEAMLAIVSLYFFSKMTSKFDRNVVVVIFLQSLSFIIRNTSPIPWVPVLLIKAHQYGKGVIQNYFLGFVCIFLPLFAFAVFADSYFYGELTIVPWNFIKINLIDGQSKTFGTDPWHKYILTELPLRFNVTWPCAILGLYLWT